MTNTSEHESKMTNTSEHESKMTNTSEHESKMTNTSQKSVNTSQKRILKEAPYSFKPVMKAGLYCVIARGIVRILGGPQDVGLIKIIIITKILFNFNNNNNTYNYYKYYYYYYNYIIIKIL